MPFDLIIAGICAGLAVAMLLSKTNASLGMLVLCAGVVLHDSIIFTLQSELFVKIPIADGFLSNAVLLLALVVLPAVVLFHFRGSQDGRFIAQILPAALLGAVLIVLLLPRLPLQTRNDIVRDSYIASQFIRFETALILVGILSAFSEQLSLHRSGLKKRKRK